MREIKYIRSQILRGFLSVIMLCFLFVYAANAQDEWFPATYSEIDTQPKDTADFQLVFYDDFTQPVLSDNWITYVSYLGMKGGDHPDWSGARGNVADIYCYSDKNVVMDADSGYCRLILKREKTKCLGGKKNFTGGMIATPYVKNGRNNGFNSGRFSARLRIPTKEGTKGAFWLWHGTEVNELDILESGGPVGKGIKTQMPYAFYNTHAWLPTKTNSQIKLPADAAFQDQTAYNYPNSHWWSLLNHQFFNPGAWHTYSATWDQDKIKYQVDHKLFKTIWKFYRLKNFQLNGKNYQLKVPIEGVKTLSKQSEPKGTVGHNAFDSVYTTFGFPYQTNSFSSLRFTTKIEPYQTKNNFFSGRIDEMVIDWVQIAQRNPKSENRKAICQDQIQPPIIVGLKEIRDSTFLMVLPAMKEGSWETNSTLELTPQSFIPGIEMIKVKPQPNFNGDSWISYHYPSTTEKNCPTKEIVHYFHKEFDTSSSIIVIHTTEDTVERFQFLYPEDEMADSVSNNFVWQIKYFQTGLEDTVKETGAGRFYAMTDFKSDDSASTYYLEWALVYQNGKTSKILQKGIRTNLSPNGRQENPNVYYFTAKITNPEAYELSFQKALGQTFFPSQKLNKNWVQTEIEKIKIDLLEPYLINPQMR